MGSQGPQCGVVVLSNEPAVNPLLSRIKVGKPAPTHLKGDGAKMNTYVGPGQRRRPQVFVRLSPSEVVGFSVNILRHVE